jgi:D-alanyl-D-alanine carboxypeptidase
MMKRLISWMMLCTALSANTSCSYGAATYQQTVMQNPAAPAEAKERSVCRTIREEDAWKLVLVNSTHPLGAFTPPELVTLRNGVQVDARIYPALQEMFDEMRRTGLSPIAGEGFRTYETQKSMLNDRIKGYRTQGYSYVEAYVLAREYVAEPGTSEHQLGIAVDINAERGDNWGVYDWLAAHAHEFGFVLRYPQGSEAITGYAYEPWHYRYVGREAAAEMHRDSLTLEEYLGE